MNDLNKYLCRFFQFEDKNDFKLVHELTFNDDKKSIEALLEFLL